MNILQLYFDFGVDFRTEGHRHCSPGWVHTPCPFCTGSPGYHLGFQLENGRVFVCWRCGIHSIPDTISALLGISKSQVFPILKKYEGENLFPVSKTPKRTPRAKAFQLPSNTGELKPGHRRYLIQRGFDPDRISREWKIQGTGMVSFLDEINFSKRLLIPIYWEERMVSFQTRDITEQSPLKYITCPKDRELIFHKNILYGNPEGWKSGIGICVEGVTDVWRFGSIAFATFGIKYLTEQVRVMSRIFRRVGVAFDYEAQAQAQASRLIAELRFRGVDAFRIDIENDPGSMSQSDADYLIKQLI